MSNYLEPLNAEDMEFYSEVICPCCGSRTYNNYWICPVCNWEYDGVLEDNMYSSANKNTLLEYRNNFMKG